MNQKRKTMMPIPLSHQPRNSKVMAKVRRREIRARVRMVKVRARMANSKARTAKAKARTVKVKASTVRARKARARTVRANPKARAKKIEPCLFLSRSASTTHIQSPLQNYSVEDIINFCNKWQAGVLNLVGRDEYTQASACNGLF